QVPEFVLPQHPFQFLECEEGDEGTKYDDDTLREQFVPTFAREVSQAPGANPVHVLVRVHASIIESCTSTSTASLGTSTVFLLPSNAFTECLHSITAMPPKIAEPCHRHLGWTPQTLETTHNATAPGR